MPAAPNFRPRPHAPQRVRFFLVRATGLMAFSTGLVSSSRRPSSRNLVRPSQWAQRIADIGRERGAGGDHRQLLLEPGLQGRDDRRRMFCARVEPDLRRCATGPALDSAANWEQHDAALIHLLTSSIVM